MPVELHWMQESDLDQVMEIESKSFEHPWKRRFFQSDLNKPSAYCWVAKENDVIAGYIVNWQVTDELHIADVAVKADFRRKGIASLLISETLALARGLGCTRIFLEVRPSNPEAVSLYKKFNFQVLYTRKSYYPNGEAAIVMELALSKEPLDEKVD
jgi:ribosomal-protein-alanine N-acetyltransferase